MGKFLSREPFCRKGSILFILTGLLSLVLLFVISIDSSAQNSPEKTKVTINKTNVTLGSVLDEIEKQTDFLFIANSNSVNLNQKVSASFVGQPLDSVLDDILGEAGINWKIEGKNIMLTRNQEYSKSEAQAGTKKISGRIIDAGGNPIIGAGILERGTTNGAVSDSNGEFNIVVKPNSILDVSCIGYKNHEVKIGGNSRYDISLDEDNKLLDEIVVIGYGTVKNLSFASDSSGWL